MNQQNKRPTALTPADPTPAKRRRGRPRKDENLVQKEKLYSPPQPPQLGELTPNQQVDNDIADNMLGKPVSGVIEGSFDAGYLLSVKIGNSGTLFRGLVFQPGHFTPITSANDVAPHAKILGKPECPNGSSVITSIQQPAAKFDNKTGLVPKTQETQLEMSQNNFKVPATDPLLKTDLGTSFGSNFMPREISKLQTAPPFGVPSNPAFGKSPFTGLMQNNNNNSFNAGFGEKYVPFQNQFAHQFHSVAAFKLGMQSGAVPVPFTSNLPKNNSDSFLDKPVTMEDNQSSALPPKNNSDVSMVGGETLQQHSDPLLDNRSMVQLHSDPPFVLSTQPDDVPKEKTEASKSSEPSPLDNNLQQVSLTENYLKNEFDSGGYLVGNNLPQERSKLGFTNIVIAQQNEMMQQQEIPNPDQVQQLAQNEASNSELKSSELGYGEPDLPLEKTDDLPSDDTQQEVIIKNPERDQSIGNGLEVTVAAEENDGVSEAATEMKNTSDATEGFQDLPFSG